MFKKRSTKKNQVDLSQIKEGQDENDGQPTKKVKTQKPESSNLIGGSTSIRKLENEEMVHKQFENLSYKKGSQTLRDNKILTGEQAFQHETQQARKRYMDNIDITKKIKQGKLSTKVYRGINSYANYQLTENQLENPVQHYKWKHGPTRSNTNSTKNTCRFDYDPSLCKDWHDSGYCVFGNSCLYLHDRSNYKTGWELQKDFEKSQRQRWKRIMNPDLFEDQQLKQIQKLKPQQSCKICNSNLMFPVQVSCSHIFCRKCAQSILQKDSKCPECSKKLNGIMNNAEKKLLKQKQNYEEMVKSCEKNKELVKAKKTKFKNIDSLNVFTSQ